MKFLIGIHIGQFAGAIFLGMVSMSAIINTMEERRIATKLVELSIYELTTTRITDI